jgi:hypothetical protein
MQKVVNVVKEGQSKCVQMAEFLDVRAEIGHLMADVRDLTTYKEDYKIRHLDLDKKLHEVQVVTEES